MWAAMLGGGAPVRLGSFVGRGRGKSMSACPTLMRCRFRVAPFLPGGHRGKPLLTLPRVGGKPRTIWSGQQHRVDGAPFLKGLLGSGCSGVLGAWWKSLDGAADANLRRFVDSLLFSFLFFWACFAVAPAFSFRFELLYHRCGCYIIYSGAKACFERTN